MEEKIVKIVSSFEGKFRAWLTSQQGQTSAYEYEKSFVELMQEVSQDTLKATTLSDQKSRNSKKKFKLQQGK